MATPAERIIEQAKHLPARDRRKVVSALEASLSRRAAGSRTRHGQSFDALIALAGTAHADARDVSSNKYAHLGAAYAVDEA
jgi:hypothetical protein